MKKYILYTANAIIIVFTALYTAKLLNKWLGEYQTGFCNYLLNNNYVNPTGWVLLYDVFSFIKILIGLILSIIILAIVHTVRLGSKSKE